jgi:ribosomal-protein-alanine N-acetyltransferase
MAEADVEAVVVLERRAYEFPWSRGIFLDCLRVPYDCQVVEEGGLLVGYSVMSMAASEAHLLNLCISPAVQGRGLGGFLLNHVLQHAKAGGARVIYLEVRPSNSAALSLYDRAGFSRIGVRRNYYRAVGGREDALVLARSLGP